MGAFVLIIGADLGNKRNTHSAIYKNTPFFVK